MKFPQLHRAHDSGPAFRLSVSFLVDEMRRVRAGAPRTSRTGWPSSARGRLLFATAAPDASEYRDRLEREELTSRAAPREDVFTASFFVVTDRDQNQIASFFTERVARARGSPSRPSTRRRAPSFSCPNDPAAMDRYAVDCGPRESPGFVRPEPAGGPADGDDLRRGSRGRRS